MALPQSTQPPELVVQDDGISEKDVSDRIDEESPESLARAEFTDEQYNKLKWKVDRWLLPLMWLIYGLQQMDKISIGHQNLFGLQQAVGLHGQQYAWLTTIFYLTYMFAEFPSNWIIQRYNLGKILSVYILLWGAMVMLTAACKTFSQLMALRALQGIFECTIGFLLMLGAWYTQQEHASRALIFMSANYGLGIICDIVIYFMGTAAKKNPTGIEAWQLIGLFIGGWTVLVSGVSFFILGTPNEVWWLTAEEKRMATARVLKNMSGSDRTGKRVLDWKQVREAFTDPGAWLATATIFVICIPNGGVSTFGTVINKAFGFTQEEVVIYSIPRSVYNMIWFYFICYVTSKVPNLRMLFMMVALVPAFAGYLGVALLPSDYSYRWAKWALYLIGITCFTPLFLGWSMIASNTAGKTKKSVVSSMVFVAYCVGNMIGSQVFRADDAPRYVRGTIIISVAIAVDFFLIGLWRWYLIRENRNRDHLFAEGHKDLKEAELEGKELGLQDITDRKNINFRYSY